jgi:hypothetical protein
MRNAVLKSGIEESQAQEGVHTLFGLVFQVRDGSLRTSARASVGHPPMCEIRRSIVEPYPKAFPSEVTHSSKAKGVVSCVGGWTSTSNTCSSFQNEACGFGWKKNSEWAM